MKSVLITGGAGFIGSHAAEELVQAGVHVRILDDLSTGKRANVPRAAELIVGDIADPAVVASALDGVDAVLHLAAIASVPRSVNEPITANRANLVGTITLLEHARAAGIERFVFASSASIYGSAAGERDGEPFPISETAQAVPQTPYAVDKYASELYAAFFHTERRMHATAFRFFNIFGERQDPSSPYSGVISIFVDRLIRGEDIVIHGDGRQTRDFVYVKDVARLLTAELFDTYRPKRMAVYNLGSGMSTTLLDIVGTLQSFTDTVPSVRFTESRVGDIRHSLADTRRLHGAFPEHTLTPFTTGLQALWRWSVDAAKQ